MSGPDFSFVILLTVAIGAPIFVLLLSIVPLTLKQRALAVPAELAAHAVCWALILFGILVLVPRLRRSYRDFGFNLRGITKVVIQISDYIQLGGTPALVLFACLVLTVDCAVFFLIWCEPPGKPVHKQWSLAMTAAFLVLLVCVESAVIWLTIELTHALA